jgi:hypothetical protein
MIANIWNLTYNKAEETMKDIKEVVYNTKCSRFTVERTKKQKTLLEILSIELY